MGLLVARLVAEGLITKNAKRLSLRRSVRRLPGVTRSPRRPRNPWNRPMPRSPRRGKRALYPELVSRRVKLRRSAKCTGVAACILLAAAWVVSIWGWGCAGIGGHGYTYSAQVASGCFVFAYRELPAFETRWFFERRGMPMRWWPGCRSTALSGNMIFLVIVLPLWMPFVALAIPVALLFWFDRRHRRRARRARAGHCAACGYDLAGLAAGAACPECGAGRGDSPRTPLSENAEVAETAEERGGETRRSEGREAWPLAPNPCLAVSLFRCLAVSLSRCPCTITPPPGPPERASQTRRSRPGPDRARAGASRRTRAIACPRSDAESAEQPTRVEGRARGIRPRTASGSIQSLQSSRTCLRCSPPPGRLL